MALSSSSLHGKTGEGPSGAGGGPIRALCASAAARGRGERRRGLCGVDPRPQLGPRRPEVARSHRPAAAGGGGPGLVIQRGGGGQEKGEEHQWASEVPKPTLIRVEGQWRGGSAVAGVRERRLWRMAALGCRGGGCGARGWGCGAEERRRGPL